MRIKIWRKKKTKEKLGLNRKDKPRMEEMQILLTIETFVFGIMAFEI